MRMVALTQREVRLFRLFGIQFTASWSWLIMLGLLAYTAEATLAGLLPGSSPVVRWALAAVAAVLAVASLYAHELAHALVALRFGVPVRTISLFLLGGVAHISRDSPSPRAELLIAIAGPLTSVGVGLVGVAVSWATWRGAPELATLAAWLAMVNLPIGLFNLVPVYPLDGGRVLRAMLWFAGQDLRWGSVVAARAGQLGAGGLLFAGLYTILTRSGSGLGGVWLILLAWFMFGGAATAHRAAVFTDTLRKLRVGGVMRRPLGTVEADLSLQEFAEQFTSEEKLGVVQARGGDLSGPFGVYRGDALVGMMTVVHLRRVPPPLWSRTTVAEAMVPLAAAPGLAPDSSALSALQLLLEEGWDELPVTAENCLLGSLSRVDLARAVERAEHRGEQRRH